MKPLQIIALSLVMAYPLYGQDAFTSPAAKQYRAKVALTETHRFFDGWNVLGQGVNIAAQAADLWTTHNALSEPNMREGNPIVSSPAARYGIKLGMIGASIGVSYWLHKAGHHRFERVIPLIVAGPAAFAAIHNSRY